MLLRTTSRLTTLYTSAFGFVFYGPPIIALVTISVTFINDWERDGFSHPNRGLFQAFTSITDFYIVPQTDLGRGGFFFPFFLAFGLISALSPDFVRILRILETRNSFYLCFVRNYCTFCCDE